MISGSKDKGSKTVNLHIQIYKELKDIQNKYYISKNFSPSLSEIIHDLIIKNKKYRRKIDELESKNIVINQDEGNINTNQDK